MDNFSEEIKSFLDSAQGKAMIESLKKDLRDNLIAEALKEKTPETAFGLLKQASGVTLALEHMMFLTVSMGERNED